MGERQLNSAEVYKGDLPRLEKVAPLLQVMLIGHDFKELYGMEIREAGSETRNQFSRQWIKENAEAVRKKIEEYSDEPFDLTDESAIRRFSESIH